MDVDLGRDPLTGVREIVRQECVALFDSPDQPVETRVRFRGIAGGNVPRPERINAVNTLSDVESMLRTGQMVYVRRATKASAEIGRAHV